MKNEVATGCTRFHRLNYVPGCTGVLFFSHRRCISLNRCYSCYCLFAILKGNLKSFQHCLWMALTTYLISLMCAGWGKYPNESEWKLGRVRIIPLENTKNLYCGPHTWAAILTSQSVWFIAATVLCSDFKLRPFRVLWR